MDTSSENFLIHYNLYGYVHAVTINGLLKMWVEFLATNTLVTLNNSYQLHCIIGLTKMNWQLQRCNIHIIMLHSLQKVYMRLQFLANQARVFRLEE